MKRTLTIFDALFLFFLLFKARGWQYLGHEVKWLQVFFPYLFAALFYIIDWYYKEYNIKEKLAYQLWRLQQTWRFNRIRRKAAKDFKKREVIKK